MTTLPLFDPDPPSAVTVLVSRDSDDGPFARGDRHVARRAHVDPDHLGLDATPDIVDHDEAATCGRLRPDPDPQVVQVCRLDGELEPQAAVGEIRVAEIDDAGRTDVGVNGAVGGEDERAADPASTPGLSIWNRSSSCSRSRDRPRRSGPSPATTTVVDGLGQHLDRRGAWISAVSSAATTTDPAATARRPLGAVTEARPRRSPGSWRSRSRSQAPPTS